MHRSCLSVRCWTSAVSGMKWALAKAKSNVWIERTGIGVPEWDAPGFRPAARQKSGGGPPLSRALEQKAVVEGG